MGLLVPWFVGVRYNGSRSGNHYLSFISRVSLFGLALGVIALTVVVSVMNGFDTQLRYRILGAVPQLLVDGPPTPALTAFLDEHPAVLAHGPFLQRHGMVIGKSNNKLVALYGVLPENEAALSIIHDHLIGSSMTDLVPGSDKAILGRPLAYQLGLQVGDEMTVIIPEPGKGGNTITPKLARLRVAGYFELDAELDYGLVLVHLNDLQGITGNPSVQQRVTLTDVFLAPRVAREIGVMLEDAVVHDWTAEYGDFFETVKMEKVMMFLLLTLIVAIAAFNIVSGLSMMVKEKASDIAVLRTLGLSSTQVMQIFIVQGSLVGAAGVLLGVLLGVPLALYVPEVVGFFEALFGGKVLAGTYFSEVPTDVRWLDIGVIVLVSLGIAVLATLYPAYQASRLQPAAILRHE
jgi:lipoprotein-releasing system permease protein